MKYYSEVTKKMYDSIEALTAAEDEFYEKDKLKEVAAAKVDELFTACADARTALHEAEKAYEEELREYCSKYGPYTATYKAEDFENRLDPALRNFAKHLGILL